MRKPKRIDNPRYPHNIRITRVERLDPFEEEPEEIVLYEGKGRSYTDTTTNGDEKMESSRRKCSIPVRFDEWLEDCDIKSGDTIVAEIGCIVEEGIVTDKEPDNNRTIIYWEYGKE